ncbi:MAG TPA: ABC transporter permease [Solirubrobacterales bacterium]|nr:ABC transporter permease [Solirubrobacterales bacterium]
MKASRLSFWVRWSLRDLRSRWPLVLAIGAVLAIGTGVSAGLGSMERWRIDSNDASFEALRAHDLEISLTEGTSAPAGTLRRLVERIPAAGQVEAVDERLLLPTQVEVRRPGAEPLLAPAELVGSPLGPQGPAIDGVYAFSGRALRGGDEGRMTAVLERGFATYDDLPSQGELRLPGGERLRYVGLGSAPEYFLVTRPGGGDFGGAESQFAVVFTSLGTAQRIAGGRPSVNNAVLLLEPGAAVGEVRGQLEQALSGARLSGEVTTMAEEPAHRVLYKDANGDQRLLDVFAFLILAGAALAAFNLATRIVEAQRREIGVGMALGVPPRQLAIRPLLLGAQIALAGTLLGLALGLMMGEIFRGVLEDLLPLPEMRTPFEVGVFVRAAAIGLVLPIAATAIPVWRGLRQTPMEAIRIGFRSARGSGIAGLAKHLRLPGSSVGQLPLRNALRAPRRTLLTVLGIGAVLSVLIAFLGLIDSFDATVDRSEAEIAQGNPDRIVVSLDGFHSARAAQRIVESAPGVAASEPQLILPVTLSAPAAEGFRGMITLLDPESSIWAPTLSSGTAPAPGAAEVVISEKAADDLGVGVGGEIEIAYPRRRGSGYAEERAEVRVSGLHPDPFRTFAYADSSLAAVAGLAGAANQVSLTPRPGVSRDQIARALFRVPVVASVERATTTSELIRERLDDFLGVLRIIEAFALALALLIAFNSSAISIDEQRRENATMLAFGLTTARTMALAVGEGLIAGILGTLAGLAGGLLVVNWVVSQTLPETLPDLGLVIDIAPASLLAVVVVGVVSVALAPLLSTRRIQKMDVPSTLRVMS